MIALSSPWSTIIYPGQSLSYYISFIPPPSTSNGSKDDVDNINLQTSIWDNFQDVIVCYTIQYPIIIPLKAVKHGTAAPEESFHPVYEAIKLPKKPSKSIFTFIMDGMKVKNKNIEEITVEEREMSKKFATDANEVTITTPITSSLPESGYKLKTSLPMNNPLSVENMKILCIES